MILKILLLLIITQNSLGKRLRPFKADGVLRSALQNIIKDNKLTGLVVYNSIERNARGYGIKYTINELLREVVSTTTIAQMNFQVFAPKFLKKYSANVTRFHFRRKNAPVIRHNLVAGDNVYFVIIVNKQSLSNKRSPIVETFQLLHRIFSSASGIAKILVVAMGKDRLRNYKRFLMNLRNKHIYNVDILQIVKDAKSRRFNYSVIQFSPFVGTFSIKKYNKQIQFFPQPTKKLNGHKFYLHIPCAKYIDDFKWGKDINKNTEYITIYLPYVYALELAVRNMNGSLKFYKPKFISKTFPDFYYGNNIGEFPKIDETVIYPSEIRHVNFIVPTLYDEVQVECYSMLIASLLAIIAIITIFRAWSKFFRLDPVAWHPIVIFSMIIAVPNPRNPLRFAVTTAFMILILAGFFYGSELIFGLSSGTIVQKVERRLENVDDLRENNVTLAFLDFSVIWKKDELKRIKHVRIDIKELRKYWVQLLLYKNVSLTTLYIEILSFSAPDRVASNGIVFGRKSNIEDRLIGLTRILPHRNAPWLHYVRYVIHKTHETNLFSMPKLIKLKSQMHKIMESFVNDIMLSVVQQESKESLENPWLILLCGYLFALSTLLIENILLRHNRH